MVWFILLLFVLLYLFYRDTPQVPSNKPPVSKVVPEKSTTVITPSGKEIDIRKRLESNKVVIPAVKCPNSLFMGEHACNDQSQCWEPCGALGHSEDHVRVFPEDDAFRK